MAAASILIMKVSRRTGGLEIRPRKWDIIDIVSRRTGGLEMQKYNHLNNS